MLGIEGLADASFDGDLRWARTARWTSYAPWVVLVLAILSMAEIALGAVWISSMKTDLNFAQVIQPLVVPGISFFNAIPSLHLHVFARVNPPRLTVWFSTSLALCFFISAIFYLGSCVGNDSNTGQISRNECPAGAQGNQRVWEAMITLQMLSGVLYSLHAAMGWTVDKALRNQERRIEQGIEMISEEEKERRHSMARERWKHLSAG